MKIAVLSPHQVGFHRANDLRYFVANQLRDALDHSDKCGDATKERIKVSWMNAPDVLMDFPATGILTQYCFAEVARVVYDV